MKLPAGWIFRVKPKLTSIEVYESELTLCKDCKYKRHDIFDRGLYCGYPNRVMDVDGDDYCSKAFREAEE